MLVICAVMITKMTNKPYFNKLYLFLAIKYKKAHKSYDSKNLTKARYGSPPPKKKHVWFGKVFPNVGG